MNLYVWFGAPAIETLKVPGNLKKKAMPVLQQIRQTNLQLPEQERMTLELISALHDPEQDHEKILEQMREECRKRRKPLWIDFADIFLVVPLLIVVWQILIRQVLGTEAGMDILSGSQTIVWGLGDLLAALCIYLVIKALIALLSRYDTGWKRWVILMGSFGVMLLIGGLTNQLSPGWNLPLWAMVIGGTLIFVLAFAWHQKLFDPQKREKRVQ